MIVWVIDDILEGCTVLRPSELEETAIFITVETGSVNIGSWVSFGIDEPDILCDI